MKPFVDIIECAEIIKDRVTIEDAVRYYFPDTTPKYRRIPCPIHRGKDRNLSYTDRVFKCFVCGASGDVISLIRQAFRLSFPDAVRKLNDDFRLGLDLDAPTVESAVAARAAAERARTERERRRLEIAEAEARYWRAFERWIRADKAIRELPWGNDEHDRAVRDITSLSYLLDMEEINLARVIHPDSGGHKADP